jgi:hypothetical protein
MSLSCNAFTVFQEHFDFGFRGYNVDTSKVLCVADLLQMPLLMTAVQLWRLTHQETLGTYLTSFLGQGSELAEKAALALFEAGHLALPCLANCLSDPELRCHAVLLMSDIAHQEHDPSWSGKTVLAHEQAATQAKETIATFCERLINEPDYVVFKEALERKIQFQ